MPCTGGDFDGDGVEDYKEFDPQDPNVRMDSDGDGVADSADAFPDDASEIKDSDGVGDNADAFPNAVTELRWGDIALNATLGDSGSTCSLVTSTFYPYVEAAAPDPSKATDAMATGVNFDLEGCNSSGETVQITIDMGTVLPSGAAVYKVVGDSWTVIPGASVNGTIISYSMSTQFTLRRAFPNTPCQCA